MNLLFKERFLARDASNIYGMYFTRLRDSNLGRVQFTVSAKYCSNESSGTLIDTCARTANEGTVDLD